MATPTENITLARDRKRVRFIAKIRGFKDPESSESRNEALKHRISVNKPKGDESESVIVTLRDQSSSGRKESYEVDFCYEDNQLNDVIFEREVSPLIPGVFDGHNATIVACGARGSGKTYMIQGLEEEPGLASQAVSKMISLADGVGKSISISCYEICQEHVFDLLTPGLEEVLVLNDGRGKTQLKGLSRVPVATISEFQKFYVSAYTARKVPKKTQTELHQRSHKGLIIYVLSSPGEKLDNRLFGKMNFVDLAGYEDARRNIADRYNLSESAKVNKSLYALKNVVQSLNANGKHVPYRESILTRMLQDSLEAPSKILMATCLNPSLCIDSMYMLSLFCRSSQGTSRSVLDLTKKPNSSGQTIVLPSPKGRELGSSSSAVKKNILSKTNFSGRAAKCSTPLLKARKLFNEPSKLKSKKPIKQASSSSITSATDSSLEEVVKAKPNSDVAQEIVPVVEENFSLISLDTASSDCQVVQQASPLLVDDKFEVISPEQSRDLSNSTEMNEKSTPITINLQATNEEEKDQENNSSLINKSASASPPISARLKEISDKLKMVSSLTPLCLEMPLKIDATNKFQKTTDLVEPATPDNSAVVSNRIKEIASYCSPWEAYNAHSVGVKNSLVKEYLKFLNTAEKEDLKKLKGIGEKRATYILELREETPEPFKDLDDLKEIRLSAKQAKKMMKTTIGGLFD